MTNPTPSSSWKNDPGGIPEVEEENAIVAGTQFPDVICDQLDNVV